MNREVLILDVTAMSGDNVCVAGVDVTSGDTIRLNSPQPTRTALKLLGYFRPGEVVRVDIEPASHRHPPHVEDHRWEPRSVEKLRIADNRETVDLLRRSAFESVISAFGEPLAREPKKNAGWSPGAGERSLATVRVRYVRFDPDKYGGVRAAILDWAEDRWIHIPFQDLVVREHRLNADGCCADTLMEHVASDFQMNAGFVRVGLTRPFSPHEDEDSALCWLQVTNVFARDRAHFI